MGRQPRIQGPRQTVAAGDDLKGGFATTAAAMIAMLASPALNEVTAPYVVWLAERSYPRDVVRVHPYRLDGSLLPLRVLRRARWNWRSTHSGRSLSFLPLSLTTHPQPKPEGEERHVEICRRGSCASYP